jgi:hypothetical protein
MIAYQLGGVNTNYASVTFSILWLGNAVVAGILSIAGPVIGALLFGLWPELAKSSVKASNISFWPQVFGAVLLIVIMAINPAGLASMARFVRQRATAYDGTDSIDDSADLRAIEAAADVVIDSTAVASASSAAPAAAPTPEVAA